MDKIRIIALGGQDEFDKKMTVVEINDNIFVINCGKKDPDKTRPGIDYVIANYDYLLKNKERVRAYILTHAFDSALGGLPYIYKDVPAPIYCSKVTETFLKSFAKHNRVNVEFNIKNINPTSEVTISGVRINFFQCSANMSSSSGVSLHTDIGNIVFSGAFVIDNNADPDFLFDAKALSRLAEEDTLVLMCESRYAGRLGYTSPKYKLIPLIENAMKEAQGRIYVAMAIPDLYNITKTVLLANKLGKKIVLYDEETSDQFELIYQLHECMKVIKRSDVLPISEINRISSKDAFILLLGWGSRLYHKIELLANPLDTTTFVNLGANDTFILGTGHSVQTEIDMNEAIDDLYHTDAKIVRFKKDEFIRMHASEEDIKTLIAHLQPKYYVPIYGTYRELLTNARLSLDMGVGLTYFSIFILDNGNVLEIENGKAKVLTSSVIAGDLYIDGKGVGDVSGSIIDDRQKFSDDGVVIMGIALNKDKTKIIGGPDIQMRGLVYLKDSDILLRELTRQFEININGAILEGKTDISYLEQITHDGAFRTIRRYTGKSPIIVPTILIANK